MLYGNNKYETYLSDRLQECLEYAKKENLLDLELGSYEIKGKDLFVNIVSYETTTSEQRFWEAHKQYLDLHYMLQGKEQIDLGFIHNMDQSPYVEADDFLPLVGDKSASVVLTPGDYLICYPEDAHRTAVQVEKKEIIKKAIFKIKIRD